MNDSDPSNYREGHIMRGVHARAFPAMGYLPIVSRFDFASQNTHGFAGGAYSIISQADDSFHDAKGAY
jgi:hypothetical protein